MIFQSINPADNTIINETAAWSPSRLENTLQQTAEAAAEWAVTPLASRIKPLRQAAELLRQRRDSLGAIITREMGKLLSEATGEIDKCARVCDYYADQAPDFLADEIIQTDAGKSLVAYQPRGPVLAIMPWNFPFWQVFRFAAPALAAGNPGLLKHAANVPLCAQAIEDVLRDAGFPAGTFSSLMIASEQAQGVIGDPRIKAVTLTGSEGAGRKVAATAGTNLKKTVLELGGSDAFIVLADADLEAATDTAVTSRFQNAGQSCIAAKRFIVEEAVAEEFTARLRDKVAALRPGDPMDNATTLAPMARADLRDELHEQVRDALDRGARAVIGCEPYDRPGFYYQPSIIDHVNRDMRAYHEELFGPVASILRAHDEADALRIANDNGFGLGGSVWTRDSERGERVARALQSGAAFVNGIVKSDPRLPFGGIERSGYGRELCHHGIREFVNTKTLWIA